jgi:predicted RNA polymerase sigma factor
MLYAEALPARAEAKAALTSRSRSKIRRVGIQRIAEAEALLMEAARMGRVGPLQLEAAIQSAHVDAGRSGVPDDRAVSLLYETLVQITPTFGVRVAHAVARDRSCEEDSVRRWLLAKQRALEATASPAGTIRKAACRNRTVCSDMDVTHIASTERPS